MDSPRSRLFQDLARRHPIAFGIDFFLAYLGASALLNYILPRLGVAWDARVTGADLATAVIFAALMTLVFRSYRGPLSDSSVERPSIPREE